MERLKKKTSKSSKKKGGSNLGDITLNDFANISLSGKRLRKPAQSNIAQSVKNIHHEEDTYETIPSEAGTPTLKEKRVRSRRKTNSETSEGGTECYPIDVWIILSRYIRPEDIGRFAGICKSTNYVVNSPYFWFNLYKRYYKPVKEMPERLRPECMTRLYELKSCVIRALYYTYPPFSSKCFVTDNDKYLTNYKPQLIKRKCMNVWSKEINDKCWQYNFILKREDFEAFRASKGNQKKPDLLLMLDDISANKEEGCLLLQVNLDKYIVTPSVLGFTLTSVNYERKTLNMTFSTSAATTSHCNIITVTLCSVETVQAHDWWSPHYPHSNSLST